MPLLRAHFERQSQDARTVSMHPMRFLRQRRLRGDPEQARGWTSLPSLWRVSILDTLRVWDKLCEAGTRRSDSSTVCLRAVGIFGLQAGEEVKGDGQQLTVYSRKRDRSMRPARHVVPLSQSRAAQNSRMRSRADLTGTAKDAAAASSRSKTTRSRSPSPARPVSARRTG